MLGLCGLKINERHILPEIWKTLQETKDWADQMVERTKWFNKGKDDDDIDVVLNKGLVEDIEKIHFSYGETPTADTAYQGITPLAFLLMSIAEEQQLRENEEVYESAKKLHRRQQR